MYNQVKQARSVAILFALGAAGLIGVAHNARGEGGEPRYFAIKNAHIVMASGEYLDGGTIVIANGLIQAVGTDVTIPPEAWVIDAKGLTAYPGLIDAGTDIGLPKEEGGEGAGAPPAGGGRARRRVAPSGPISMGPEDRPYTTPWRVAADELKTDDKRIESWRNAGFTTALVVPEGGLFPGQASVVNLAGERPGDMVVKPLAALPISLRPTGGFFGFPGSLMGGIAYDRQLLDDARWYAAAGPIDDANPSKLERLPYDRAERVVSDALRSGEIVLLPANSANEILRALRLADEWHLRVVLTGAQQGYEVAETLASKRVPVLVSLKWPERAKDSDPEGDQTLRELRFRDHAPSTPAALAKAGAKFAFYSDGLAGPKDILKNVRKAIDAGLSPAAALRAFTADAAEILGVSDRLGNIAPGKIANLILADGDIFNEKTKVKHAFVDGRWFEIHEGPPPEKPGEKKPMRGGNVDAAQAGVDR
ncbi:MAG: amidohydrolase family protein [Candidatus Acidiferrales bacterium]